VPIAVTIPGQLAAVPLGVKGIALVSCVVLYLSQILRNPSFVSLWLKQDAEKRPQAKTA